MSGIANWYKNNHSEGLYSKKLYIESQSCHIARKEILFIRKECKDSEVFVKMLDNQQKKEGCTVHVGAKTQMRITVVTGFMSFVEGEVGP